MGLYNSIKGKISCYSDIYSHQCNMTMKRKLQSLGVPELLCHRKHEKLHRVPRATLSLALDSRKVTSERCRDKEGLSPHAEEWRDSLQRETGRIRSPEPKQNKSEGGSDWKADRETNSRNRKRLVHSVIVLMQEQEPGNKQILVHIHS